MPYEKTIQRVRDDLHAVFDGLDSCSDLPQALREHHPTTDAWSIDEILEHITLTNHFLMLTLRKSAATALKRAQTQLIKDEESDLDLIVRISDSDAFAWVRPEHMEPTRQMAADQVRGRLTEQRTECLAILDSVRDGEGSLHRVRMSVQNLGKLDVYQWLYFLVQHAKRHAIEIERINSDYLSLGL